MQARTTTLDPLRRFLPTSLAANFPVMGRTIRLETNSATVLGHTQRLFEPYAGQAPAQPDFLWRIVGEGDTAATPPWPEVAVFSDDGLRYVSFGHRSFLAVDLEAREAVAFLAEGLANEESGFNTPFVDRLLVLTSGALGLTSIAAACVAIGQKGLLIFGPPKSGKTTSCYLATRLGLEFHDDQALFIEVESGSMRGWSGSWPATFRADALRFLPELEALTRPFRYGDQTFLYLRGELNQARGRYVIPACCVFLQRKPGTAARLTRLSPAEFADRLDGCLLFTDDARFEAQQTSVLRALARLPAYRLSYGNDPGDAAAFFPRLLEAHPVEADW